MSEEKKLRQLIDALQAQKSQARLGAIGRVPMLGKAGEELVPLLHKLLQDRDPNTRVTAARSCLSINRGDVVALDALVREIKTGPDGPCREEAVILLELPHTRANAAAIAPGLTDPSERVRAAAVYALGKIGRPAAEFADLVASLLQHGKKDTRAHAAYTLGSIAGPTPEAISALIAALTDKSADVRSSSALALMRLGPPAKRACGALVHSLKDRDDSVRWQAVCALGDIGCRGSEVFSALVESLSDEYPGVVVQAADALGNFGPDALPALPALRKALETCHRISELTLKMAIEKITASHDAEA